MTYPTFVAGTLSVLIPAAALATVNVGDTLGTTSEEVRAQFEANGYTVLEIELEDDEIEVEYLLDGQEYEAKIALATGLVTEIELEDEDDD